ncbi:sigma-70 family RNA polymerase sigma factor [Actinopolymorpha alba]|uniref:sigma-70 family RNA polymerase sigma factor n=1 Tax=Actinopolymorpha alba TaxID=533267 RepID=UPI000365EA40|nr:sigma-70 family RNA polymerase sigma factor [Actinopolymorpha alba]
MDDNDITRLLCAAQRGDRTGYEAFVHATQASLHRLLTYLVDAGTAEDLTQETYLRAFTALPRYEARSPARLWLFAIARRVAADHFRASHRRPRHHRTDDWAAAAERRGMSAPAPDSTVSLRLAIADLHSDRREAFVLTQMLGLSYDEAAKVCGCATGTIRSRVFRARTDLVAALSPVDELRHESRI